MLERYRYWIYNIGVAVVVVVAVVVARLTLPESLVLDVAWFLRRSWAFAILGGLLMWLIGFAWHKAAWLMILGLSLFLIGGVAGVASELLVVS